MPPKPPLLKTHHDVAALRVLGRRGRRWRPRRADRRRLCRRLSSPASAVPGPGVLRARAVPGGRLAATTTASASAKAPASSAWKTLRRVVLVRGSKMAQTFCVRILDAQRAQGLANRGGMMAEVVHHRHAAGNAAHFHAALDALEGVEGGLDLVVLEAAMLGAGDDRQRVAHVEFADEVECGT